MADPLYDPTDFGNKPGAGPLRIGGVPGTPESDSNKPSIRSKQAAMQQHTLTLVRDLWEGTDRVRRQAELYLPRAVGEDSRNYNHRLARSAFFNAFRRTVEGLSGLVFRKDPELSDDVPPQIAAHWENIDNAGTHGDVFCRDLLQDDLIDGHVVVLVDFPNTGGAQDAGQEMLGEVRPYWVPIKKDDIMSWRTRQVLGRIQLTQFVYRQCTYVPDGMFGEKEQTLYRVFTLGEDGVPTVRVYEERDGVVMEHTDLAGRYPTQDEIPVAEITSAGKRGMFISDPPLKDLAFLNVAHYQMWSDYNWSIYKTCVPFIFGSGIPDAIDSNGQRVPMKVGANSAVITNAENAKMMYVSHSGESLDSVKAALDDLKSDMGSLGLAMLAPQKRAAETAEAKRLDKATSDSALAATARGLQDGLERALYFHARYLKLDDGGSIEVNRDFEGLIMDAPVMQAYAALRREGFPAGPILKMLQAGGRIAEDEDLDMLELEMEANRLAEEERERAEAADRAEQLNAGVDDAA